MSEETAEYQVKMNGNTRNEFARYGLEILKRSMLLVLYEETDSISEEPPLYPDGRTLTAERIRKRLGIIKPQRSIVSINALIRGVLDHLQHDKYVYHYGDIGWAITEKGVKVIEGSA